MRKCMTNKCKVGGEGYKSLTNITTGGFTLVELLAVIVIMIIILGITIPSIINGVKNAKEKQLERTKDMIIAAARSYVIDYDEDIPASLSLISLCNEEYLKCPIKNSVDSTIMDGYINIDEDKNYSYSEDTRLYYHYSVITLNLDGGESTQELEDQYVDGDTINLNIPTRSGYIFAEWSARCKRCLNNNTYIVGRNNDSIKASWIITDIDFNYTGDVQTFEVPATGWYKIELWGAQGGSYNTTYKGGYGGYTSGEIYLESGTTIYVYVGETGFKNININSYNGGGIIPINNSYTGGGATDVRLVSGNWSDSAALNSRIMVAAGGGGVGNYSSTYVSGGSAGGLIGSKGVAYLSGYPDRYGGGATQIAGGSGGSGNSTYAGSFGKGGLAGYYSSWSSGSGGGGYYGGGSGIYEGNSGGGGSSFISGYAGVNAITSSSSTTPTNNTKHYSGKYFIDGEMQSGVNSGNGKAQITYIGSTQPARTYTNLNNVRYIKDCINGNSTDGVNWYNQWVELQAIYNGINVAYGKTVTGTSAQNGSFPYTRIVDGDITSSNYAETSVKGLLECITVDLTQGYNLEEIAVWHYWVDGRTYYSNTTYVSSDNSTWIPVIANTYAETSQGKRVSAYSTQAGFDYTGNVQTYIAPVTGTYKLEVWGAQGGYYSSLYPSNGSYGSYSNGKIYLEKDANLYIYIGGAGSIDCSTSVCPGGYNGGGNGGRVTQIGSSGGGATHIATISGLLSTLSSNQSTILIVAAGGGGTGGTNLGYGGSGGGISGGAGYDTWTSNFQGYNGTGASQTAAGYSYQDSSVKGGFGYGSDFHNLTYGGSGGGGGYYGGGGSSREHGGAGGGSGYIGNSNLTDKSMYCYNCTTSSTASTLTYSTTNVSSSPISNYAKSGNGYARISLMETN